MNKVQHFVITRFNLKLSDAFNADKRGVSTQSDEWLSHRFSLFEQYCLPSLASQTNKDFTWFLLFDESTPDKYRERVEQAKTVCPQIVAYYIEEAADVLSDVFAQIDTDTDVLITTRIDNDDAFRDDALQVIRDQLKTAHSDLCVSFRFGYLYDGSFAEVISHKYNPFSSLIEFRKTNGFVTIFGATHGRIHKLAKFKQIKTSPYWLMVVHDRNVANKMPVEYRNYNLWKPRRLKKYIKKYVLKRLRRLFWASEFKRKYTLAQLKDRFHMRSN